MSRQCLFFSFSARIRFNSTQSRKIRKEKRDEYSRSSGAVRKDLQDFENCIGMIARCSLCLARDNQSMQISATLRVDKMNIQVLHIDSIRDENSSNKDQPGRKDGKSREQLIKREARLLPFLIINWPCEMCRFGVL